MVRYSELLPLPEHHQFPLDLLSALLKLIPYVRQGSSLILELLSYPFRVRVVHRYRTRQQTLFKNSKPTTN